jgi:tight adherence protein C
MTLPSSLYLIASLISMAIVLLSILLTIYYLSRRVPPTIRVNMDEIPSSLSKVWWLVSFFQYYIVQYLPKATIQKRQKLLNSAGLEFFLKPTETYGLQFMGASLALFFAGFVSATSGLSLSSTALLCIGITVLGWMYPLMWLTDQKKKRLQIILRSMPSFLDILTLCCECGLTLNSGLTNYCEKGPKGPLRNEMERALRDMKGGATRTESLHKLATRMANPDLSMFVSIVVQCEKLGVPLGDAMRRFSEQKRTERFQRAEKLAMEAPMKIIGPLVIFIFPITFIIIAFPIVISAMENLK